MNFYGEQEELNRMDSAPEEPHSTEKVRILDTFVTSILRPKELVDITIKTKNKFKRYVFFMSILVTVMVFLIPFAMRIMSFGGFEKLFSETMPNIQMEDGKLIADKRFEMNLGYADILIDTNLSEYKFEDFTTEGNFVAIGADKTKLVRVGDVNNEETYSVLYSYDNSVLFPRGFSNEFLIKCIPLIYIVFGFVLVICVFVYALRYIVTAAIYAILSRSLTAIIKVNLSFKDAFHLCFYAQTVAILLTNINSGVGYIINPTFASIIGVIITVVFIHKAVRPYMPSMDDILNNMKGNNRGNDFFK